MLAVDQLYLKIAETRILNGVTVTFKKGESVGVIGPNGSGKTSLFNCISGFAAPQRGRVLLDGSDVTVKSPHQRALLGLGRVFQNFGVFREMTVEENIITALESRTAFFRTIIPWSKESRIVRDRAREYLGQIGLGTKSGAKAGSLSGGQMRLLEIIRTLAFGAEVFLLDEPTAGVSPRMKDQVLELIVKLKELGKTILIIEHDINFVQQFCSRIVVLDVGQVVLDDTPERVRQNKLLEEIYFGKHSAPA